MKQSVSQKKKCFAFTKFYIFIYSKKFGDENIVWWLNISLPRILKVQRINSQDVFYFNKNKVLI